MRASKHLEKCTEECPYNSGKKCGFGIRKDGCYLDISNRSEPLNLLKKRKKTTSIEVQVKKVKGLVLREVIAQATYGNCNYEVSLSNGCIIFEFPDGKEKYGVLLSDLLQKVIEMEKE